MCQIGKFAGGRGLGPIFATVITHDFALLCTITKSVVMPNLDEEEAADLKHLLKTCYQLNEDRVRIAHGFWIVAEDSGQLLHGRKGELDPASHFNEAQAIARKADLMNSLNYQKYSKTGTADRAIKTECEWQGAVFAPTQFGYCVDSAVEVSIGLVDADASAEMEVVGEDDSFAAGSCSPPVGAGAGTSAGTDVLTCSGAELAAVSSALFSDLSGDKAHTSSDSELFSAMS
jgi:hypothetical protein